MVKWWWWWWWFGKFLRISRLFPFPSWWWWWWIGGEWMNEWMNITNQQMSVFVLWLVYICHSSLWLFVFVRVCVCVCHLCDVSEWSVHRQFGFFSYCVCVCVKKCPRFIIVVVVVKGIHLFFPLYNYYSKQNKQMEQMEQNK